MSVTDKHRQANLTIKSSQRSYEVAFNHGFETMESQLAVYENMVLVIDKRVSELYKSAFKSLKEDRPVLEVEVNEGLKTLEGIQFVIEWLLRNNCNRSTTIVGIGGGIVQDLVTFTSNIFYRGTSFVLLPTTLLSMADSCIGSKCGINFGPYKNQLGVIHAPKGVHIFTEFLESLDEIEIKSGYGEVLKLAVTGSQVALDSLITEVDAHGLRGDHLLKLIHQSLLIKKKVVEKDEFEVDLRRILNYGHTFGHALEALTHHAIPHGLAVAWGIDLINFLRVEQDHGFTETDLKIHEFISQHLPFSLREFPSATELVQMVRRDKKMSNGLIHLATPRNCGDIFIRPTVLDEKLSNLVDKYLKIRNVYGSKV